jgi:hypothetical protein
MPRLDRLMQLCLSSFKSEATFPLGVKRVYSNSGAMFIVHSTILKPASESVIVVRKSNPVRQM